MLWASLLSLWPLPLPVSPAPALPACPRTARSKTTASRDVGCGLVGCGAWMSYGGSKRKYARFGRKLPKLPWQAKICTPPGGEVIAKICNVKSEPSI